ncbi:MAG: serine hydrolase [Pseudomonadota bacterium]|nr:serine hydrolase [Pseudomonadota bacterium]
MTESTIHTLPNPDLRVVAGNKSHWSQADHRRHGWHNLHRLARYSTSFRSARVMTLEKRNDLALGALDSVQRLTALPWFSAMVVIRGQHVLYERYAPDFSRDQPHSIQSITKTLLNLIIGRLVEQGTLELSRTVAEYLPEIGSGYAAATLQQVLNMDVVNDYSEDFTDPHAPYYDHEEAMGWRLPADPQSEPTEHAFLARIGSADTANHTGHVNYKDANTAVLAWVAERASGRPLRAFIADIVDAAGLEGAFHITTDREGVPTVEGGACLTARDLARYFSIFARRGVGIGGERVGSAAFMEKTLAAGVPMPEPYQSIRYSNQMMLSGRCLGHGGWGGQYALLNMDTGAIGVFFSVIENEHANNGDYLLPIMAMLEHVTGR